MMTGMIFFQLLCSVVIIAFILVAFNETNGYNLQMLLANCNIFALNVIMCYVYCYFSEQVTGIAVDIGDVVYKSLWYKMPVKDQILIGLVIVRAQKEFRMSGFGIIECSLELFLTVR